MLEPLLRRSVLALCLALLPATAFAQCTGGGAAGGGAAAGGGTTAASSSGATSGVSSAVAGQVIGQIIAAQQMQAMYEQQLMMQQMAQQAAMQQAAMQKTARQQQMNRALFDSAHPNMSERQKRAELIKQAAAERKEKILSQRSQPTQTVALASQQ
ncbi:hypothetical protein [Planctomicrobium piriforme]|uniref:Uncharacterized protein n=1 Tax=Planctomicrobium piriforme TaxID=1576369 RepID=A0A1I3GQC6_9PLAN|nr:hypothetical protein [Planctomicrobium piriforme]SFI25559.1 hypothetical protein SAMN05421753_10786 [Planctomicrobium piriforme]